jgi:hypothetical protein
MLELSMLTAVSAMVRVRRAAVSVFFFVSSANAGVATVDDRGTPLWKLAAANWCGKMEDVVRHSCSANSMQPDVHH